MPKEKLILHPKRPKGEDGYKTFSIRIKDETVEKLEDICRKTGYIRNELISVFIDYAIENIEIAHA